MPDNSGNRAVMRAGRHSIRCFASFIAPDPIASGTLSATPPYPMGGVSPYVNTTYVVGAFTDVKQGMEVAFFDTATGAFKGRTHVRYGGTISALNLPIREFTQAMYDLVSGDTFRIYDEYRLHDKLVAALNDFPPDMRFYADADAGDEPEPVVNSGGDWAGFVDNYGTSTELTYATVVMTGSTSFTVYPVGGTITHDWTLPTGVAFAPGSAASDDDPTLRVNTGTYVITHEGEDDATNRVRESHPSIRVHNDADPPHRVLVTAYEGTVENGWNWEVEIVSGDVDFTTIPDGCKCILWTRERYGDSWASYRNISPGRSHILGVGYVSRDTSNGSGADGVHRLSIEVISPLERLRQIKSYSKVMLEDANPDSWSEMTDLGVLRGILQILQFYTMWCEAGFDTVVDDDLLDERYPSLFLDANNFFDQLMELAQAIDARIIVDRTGRLDLHTHPAYIPLADRAAVTTALELADADILDYEWTREHAIRVALMKVSGISGGEADNLPVFSLYPGAAAGEGIDAPEIARLILDETSPQDDINERAGRYGALADMLFYDADGIRHNAFDLNLTLRGAYDVFDFYKEYLEVVITGNKRGIDLSGRRFYLLSSSTDMSPDGNSTTDLTLRMETNAAEGETFIPPDDTTPGGDGQPPPYEPPVTVPDAPAFPLGSGRYIIVDDNNSMYYTASGNSAVPVWAEVPLTLTGAANDFISDPFCPLYLGTGTDLWLRLTTATRIYLIEVDTSDMSVTETDQKTLPSASQNLRRIEMERGVANFVAVVSSYVTTNTKVVVTTDGSTWGSEVTINAEGAAYGVPGLFVSGRTAGKIITSEGKGNGGNTNGKVSTNYGVSYATVTSPNLDMTSSQGGAFGLHFPWHNNSSEALAYYGWTDRYAFHDGTSRLYMVNGATQTDISPTDGSNPLGAAGPRSIDSAPTNRLRMACALYGGTAFAGDSSDPIRLYYSLDGGVTLNNIAAFNVTAGSAGYAPAGVRVLGDGSGFIAFGTGAFLHACDFAGNHRDIAGNLAALGCGRVLNIVGW